MYLFEKKNNSIDVYTMYPEVARMRNYRIAEMKQIGEEERVLKAVSNLYRELERDENTIPFSEVHFERNNYLGETVYHELSTYEMDEEVRRHQEILLSRYYHGDFSQEPVLRIRKSCYSRPQTEFPHSVQYLLRTTKEYRDEGFLYKRFVMHDMIQLPESLALLQQLECGDFSSIHSHDLTEQLKTFVVSNQPIKHLSLDELSDMYSVGLIPGRYSEVIHTIETTGKVLQKVRENEGK